MTNEEILSALERAYSIIDQFNDIVNKELEEDKGVLPLSDNYEDLNSALGYIGQLLDSHKHPAADAFRKLAISKPETRKALSSAYQACEIVGRNIIAGSELDSAVSFLKSCLYSMLAKTYGTAAEAQESIQQILEICDCGDKALDDIASMPQEMLDAQYMNPAGQRIEHRSDQLRRAFASMRPKYDPDKDQDQAKSPNGNPE